MLMNGCELISDEFEPPVLFSVELTLAVLVNVSLVMTLTITQTLRLVPLFMLPSSHLTTSIPPTVELTPAT